MFLLLPNTLSLCSDLRPPPQRDGPLQQHASVFPIRLPVLSSLNAVACDYFLMFFFFKLQEGSDIVFAGSYEALFLGTVPNVCQAPWVTTPLASVPSHFCTLYHKLGSLTVTLPSTYTHPLNFSGATLLAQATTE